MKKYRAVNIDDIGKMVEVKKHSFHCEWEGPYELLFILGDTFGDKIGVNDFILDSNSYRVYWDARIEIDEPKFESKYSEYLSDSINVRRDMEERIWKLENEK